MVNYSENSLSLSSSSFNLLPRASSEADALLDFRHVSTTARGAIANLLEALCDITKSSDSEVSVFVLQK